MILSNEIFFVKIKVFFDRCKLYHLPFPGSPNSAKFRRGGGVAEGQPRFDNGGVAIIFYALKISL